MHRRDCKVVLCGTGSLFALEAGALAAISEQMNIKEIAASGGGTLVAAAYFSGFDNPKKLKKFITRCSEMSSYMGKNWWSFLWNWGITTHHDARRAYQRVFDFPEMSLGDIHRKGKELTFVACNVNRRREMTFSSRDVGCQEMPIWLAALASSSMPGLIEPCPVPNYYMPSYVREEVNFDDFTSAETRRKELYVDGCISTNYPVDVLTKHDNHLPIVSVKIGNFSWKHRRIDNLAEYISAVVNSLVDVNEKEDSDDVKYYPGGVNPVYVEYDHHESSDYKLTEELIYDMYQEGYEQATFQLDKML